MDLVKFSIVGGLAFAGLLTFAATTRHGRADPLPPPMSVSAPTQDPSEVAQAPILITPATRPSPVVSLGGAAPSGSLSPFPVATPATASARFDVRRSGNLMTWDPLVQEASRRFGIPSSWVRSVMRAESAGREFLNGRPITSSAGAMGLMQLMPGTYAELRARYGFGPDPYDPRDNVLAGTAYLREMLDRFGPHQFLAAYNAGPGRLADYLAYGRPLPDETRRYVAALTPTLSGVASASPTPMRAGHAGGVQDLTATSLLPAGALTAVRAPVRPEQAPLFVASVNSGSADRPQPGSPPNDGLFVALSGTTDRRSSPAPTARDN